MNRFAMTISLGLFGCHPIAPKPDTGTLRFESEDPTITGLAMACDTTMGRWTIDLRTDAWVGTARLWMATSATAVEQHALEVKRSAADASWDCFDQTIEMARDLGSPGSDTRYRCTQLPALHMLLAVSDAGSERWTDCAVWGPDANHPWDADPDVPTCTNVLTDAFADGSDTYSTGDVASCD